MALVKGEVKMLRENNRRLTGQFHSVEQYYIPPVLPLDEDMRRNDERVLRALAENMTLAPSNDVRDTVHWLREHYSAVGLAGAVEWFARCAASREADPFVKQLDWKAGILPARNGHSSESE